MGQLPTNDIPYNRASQNQQPAAAPTQKPLHAELVGLDFQAMQAAIEATKEEKKP